jgi:enamine deaminase RidA (YjgF/YER057c/UK114 family)
VDWRPALRIHDFGTRVVNTVHVEPFDEPRPARSTVAVAALPIGAEIEMRVTALAHAAG